MHQLRKGTWSPKLNHCWHQTSNTLQRSYCMFLMLLFTCCLLSVWLLMLLTWCGEAEQHQPASVTCLKCLSHLILEPSEKCSPGWKDEAIQNGNIYLPSQHSFSSSLSVWVSFGALMINIELFTKNRGATSDFLPFAWKKWLGMKWLTDYWFWLILFWSDNLINY